MAAKEVKFRDFFEGIQCFAIHTIVNPFTELDKSAQGVYRMVGLCWNWCLFAVNGWVLTASVRYLHECLQDDQKIYTIALPTAWILLYLWSLELSWILYINCQDLVSILCRFDGIFPATPTTTDSLIIRGQLLSWNDTVVIYRRIVIITTSFVTITPLVNATIGYVRNAEWTLVLPMFISYPFDPHQAHLIGFVYLFEAFMFHEITSLFWLTVGLLGAATSQINIQLSILAGACRTLKPSKENCEECKDQLRELIKQHIHILQLCEDVRDLFSLTFLIQFIFISVILCVMVFIMIHATDLSLNIYAVFCTICIMCFSYLIYEFAEQVSMRSTSISFAIYECDWFEADLEFKKLMLMMMQRAEKPCSFTGMGFFTLSRETLAKIFTKSYSYFMMLQSYYD